MSILNDRDKSDELRPRSQTTQKLRKKGGKISWHLRYLVKIKHALLHPNS